MTSSIRGLRTTNFLSFVVRQHNSGPGRLIVEIYRSLSHSPFHTHTDRAGLLWTSDQLVAEAAAYTVHNKHNRRTNPCTLRGSNPRSQQSSGFSSRFLHKIFYHTVFQSTFPSYTSPAPLVLCIYSLQWRTAIVSYSRDRLTSTICLFAKMKRWKWSTKETTQFRIHFCSWIEVKWETLQWKGLPVVRPAIWKYNSKKDRTRDYSRQGCNTVQSCGWIKTFQTKHLPSSGSNLKMETA